LNNILIVSAHADDEAFGMGGTLLKLSKDKENRISWLIFSKIWEPKWNKEALLDRQKSINKMNEIFSFDSFSQFDFKDNKLDTYSINEMQEKLICTINDIKPTTIFTPSIWDFNHDHRIVCELVEMSTKSYYSPSIKEIIAYEIPSSTDHSFSSVRKFLPNLYFDISSTIEEKLNLLELYSSELNLHPHPRSKKYVKSLARIRGGESGSNYAEAFHIMKSFR
jgi:N-acetylglucosamine malate deacetylase 1